ISLWPLAYSHLPFAICHLPSAICHLPLASLYDSTTQRLYDISLWPLAYSNLPSAISYLPLASLYDSTTQRLYDISLWPLAYSHLPFAICHLPSAIRFQINDFTPFLAYYHLINAEPQVKPAPKAARHTRSPSCTLPCSHASHKAIGTEAAVVFPYFWILLNT